MEDILVQSLLKLVKLDGPSRSERPVADYLKKEFATLKFRVEEDNAKEIVKGNTGNLLCFPPHFNPDEPALLLVAHMDTVRSTKDMIPIIQNDKITSANNYAIGVDNRAGITVLLNGARNLIENNNQTNVIFAFTVCEEIGPVAANNLVVPKNVNYAYIFDSSARPGTFIQSTFGAKSFSFQIKGKSAHAGLEPEKGVNAIYLASQIISQIPMGRISKDLTCNVAYISGGGPSNVVPDFVQVKGEVRASEQRQLEDFLDQMRIIIQDTCKKNDGDFVFETKTNFLPYRISEDTLVFKLLCDVLQSLKLEPNPIHYSGGSDANVFNEKGLLTINIGIGAQHPHAQDEFILIEDLIMSYKIATKIIDEYRLRNLV